MKKTTVLAILVASLIATGQAQGVLQWPMPGHDPQRTSRASEGSLSKPTKPAWFKNFNTESKGYIPSKASLVTVAGATALEDRILVPTSKGLYALRATDGADVWFYPTSMPAGNSPTISDGVVYFGCFDKTIHAVDLATGSRIWQTLEAGAGFDTNPLVINGTVLAGNRDGYFYAFNASDGNLKWAFETEGRISFSAAASSDNSVVYFASKDGFAYALHSVDGALVWKSGGLYGDRFPGDGFYSFWPVVAAGQVLFPGSQNHYPGTLTETDAIELFPNGVSGDSIGPVDANGWIDASKVLQYFAAHPSRRAFFAVNASTGQETSLTPVLWVGNSSGNRYPPTIGSDGYVYVTNVWRYHGNWLKGRVSAWQMGTSKIRNSGVDHDSADENGAISIIGGKLFYNHKGAQTSQYVELSTGVETKFWSGLSGIFAGFDDGWAARRYGDDYASTPNSSATHGNVNPTVPIRNMVCFHSAGSVLCFKEL